MWGDPDSGHQAAAAENAVLGVTATSGSPAANEGNVAGKMPVRADSPRKELGAKFPSVVKQGVDVLMRDLWHYAAGRGEDKASALPC